jgi:predicted nucleic acid-binding protein
MILLDTNIIVYSLDKKSSKNYIATNYIKRNAENLTITHQNINEAIRVITHPKHPKPMRIEKAIEAVTDIAEGLSIIFPKENTIFITLELLNKYKIKSNHVFDAYLAATMLSNGIEEIATDNGKDFSIIKEVKVINPFSKN